MTEQRIQNEKRQVDYVRIIWCVGPVAFVIWALLYIFSGSLWLSTGIVGFGIILLIQDLVFGVPDFFELKSMPEDGKSKPRVKRNRPVTKKDIAATVIILAVGITYLVVGQFVFDIDQSTLIKWLSPVTPTALLIAIWSRRKRE